MKHSGYNHVNIEHTFLINHLVKRRGTIMMMGIQASILILFSMCIYSVQCYDMGKLRRCTDPAMDNPGYSSVQRNGDLFWSHCGFPNPKLEQRRCGRTFEPTVKYDLCDPDQILPIDTKAILDMELYGVEMTTPYQCTPWHGGILNYTIIVVLVRHLKIPDLSSYETCINNCGEVVPDLDEITRLSTAEEQQMAIDSFAQGLANEYNAYFCDNLVVIAYWHNATMISTGLTDRVSQYLTASIISDITQQAQQRIAENDLEGAFNIMISEYRRHILGFTPAMILLVIHMSLIVLLCISAIVYFFFGGKSDYYDEEKWKIVLKVFLKIVFGVWFIEQLLVLLVRVQDKMKPWVIIIPLLCMVGAIVGAIMLQRLEDSKSNSGNA